MDKLLFELSNNIPSEAIPIVLIVVVYIIISFQRQKSKDSRDSTEEYMNKRLLNLERDHSIVEKHNFEIIRLKDDMALTKTIVDDLRVEMATFNTNISVLSVEIKQLSEAIKELKK